MKHEMKGFDRVFFFTFRQHWKGKSFLRATVIVAILCFLLPALILPLVELLEDNSASVPEENPAEWESALERVYVVDTSDTVGVDMSFLNSIPENGFFPHIEYISCEEDSALRAIEEDGEKTLILYLEQRDGGYAVQVLTPEKTVLDAREAMIYTDFINASLHWILAAKLGIELDRADEIYAHIEIAEHRGGMIEEGIADAPPEEEIVTPQEQTRQLLAMILPYFNIMILYFMVLFYGQGVANSVILEKTSKLVDTFLVTVQPVALVMGKLFAITVSGALQLLIWLVSLLGGFGLGAVAVRLLSPDSQMGLLLFIDQIELWGGVFSLPAILISVLMLCSGFLLYCSLAAIGGAMASKPEELSSTNSLFSMVLIISFLCTLYAGGMSAGMSSSEAWLNWVPFTAIFVVPSRVLIGEMTVGGALLSLLAVMAVTFLLVWLAGKVYRLLILYKGKVPKLGDVLKMLGNRS